MDSGPAFFGFISILCLTSSSVFYCSSKVKDSLRGYFSIGASQLSAFLFPGLAFGDGSYLFICGSTGRSNEIF